MHSVLYAAVEKRGSATAARLLQRRINAAQRSEARRPTLTLNAPTPDLYRAIGDRVDVAMHRQRTLLDLFDPEGDAA